MITLNIKELAVISCGLEVAVRKSLEDGDYSQANIYADVLDKINEEIKVKVE